MGEYQLRRDTQAETNVYINYVARLTATIAGLKAENNSLNSQLEKLREAIRIKGGDEHYPTEDAYLAACKAIESKREEIDRLKIEINICDGARAWLKKTNVRLLSEINRLKAENEALKAERDAAGDDIGKYARNARNAKFGLRATKRMGDTITQEDYEKDIRALSFAIKKLEERK